MPRALLLAALLLLPALAGCLGAQPSATPASGSAACVAGSAACAIVDGASTVAPKERQANELSIAVNPTNPLNVIATGKDYTPDEAGDCTWAGVYATTDGGKTWKDQNVPGSPWKMRSDPTAAQDRTPFSTFWCATDPVVRFGPDGTAYWAVMPYQCDPASGSKTGEGTLPQGGLNDFAFTCSAMYILVSTDGGLTWPLDKARQISTGGYLVHDKEWIAVSQDGNRLVYCWDYQGLGATTPDMMVHAPDPNESGVVCSVSKDKANTWSDFAFATAVGGSPEVDFDAKGKAWMVVTGADGHYVLSSDDGLKWSQPVKAATFKDPSAQNAHGRNVLNGSEFRVSSYGTIAVDRGNGTHAGRVYVAYFDYSAGNGETMLVWSDDGKTWSQPVRVNDDAGSADQFLPALSVGPDGTVDVSWQDRRDDPANHLFATYYAYSLDGGATFSRNQRVSSALSDEQYSHHQNGDVFLGDYRDMGSSRGSATMVWVDTRNHKADAFVATVPRPSADAAR